MGKPLKYRVVYGETIPAWEREFPTLEKAKSFASHQERCGDVIFYVGPITPSAPRGALVGLLNNGE